MTETEKTLLAEVREKIQPGSGFTSLNLRLLQAKIEFLLGEREDGYVEGVGAFLPESVTPLAVLSYARASGRIPDDLRDRISELLPVEITSDMRLLGPARVMDWVKAFESGSEKVGASKMKNYLMHRLVELGALQTVAQWNAVFDAPVDEAMEFDGPWYFRKNTEGNFVDDGNWTVFPTPEQALCVVCSKSIPREDIYKYGTKMARLPDENGRVTIKCIEPYCSLACVAKTMVAK